MGFWVKSSSGWTTAKSVWVKSGTNTWSSVKKLFVKTLGGWVQFWPKAGPYTTTSPYFSSSSSEGGTAYSSSDIDISSTGLYGQKGVWDPNGYTISSYTYKTLTFTASTGGSATTVESGTYTIPVQIGLSSNASSYDGKYIAFQVTANTTSGITGVDSSDSSIYSRIFVHRTGLRQKPGYSPYMPTVGSYSSTTDTVTTGGHLITYNGPYTLTFYNYMDSTAGYLPDSTRSTVDWYSSTGSSPLSSISSIIASGTKVGTVTPSISIDSVNSIYNVTATFNTPATFTTNTYYYAIHTEKNSYTDYTGTPYQTFLSIGPFNQNPTATTYPTLTASMPSTYVGNLSSFTIGATITGNTGVWSPVPNGSNPITSAFKLSSQSSTSLSSQSSWGLLGISGTSALSDTSNNTSHTFTLPSTINASTSVGKYLEYAVTAENGSIFTDFYTNASTAIYAAPTASTSVTFAYASDNRAQTTWGYSSSYSYYILQYSSDGSTGWTSLTPEGYSTPNVTYTPAVGPGITPLFYSTLPSGTKYYRVVSYNGDGVGIPSTLVTYNSTPPAYTYYTGNTIYVSTNGYASFESANSASYITSTVGKVLGYLPGDLYMNTMSYAADTDGTYNYWRVLWQGRRLSGGTDYELRVELLFQNGSQIVSVSWYIASGVTGTITSNNPGFYYNGVANWTTSGISNGTLLSMPMNIGPSPTIISSSSFFPKGSSWNGWVTTTSVTSGTNDDGYVTMNTAAPDYPRMSGTVSSSSITSATALISWTAPTNNGGSAITSYDYKIGSGGTWTSNGTTQSVTLTGLSYSTPYTIYVRAYNAVKGAASSDPSSVYWGSTSFTTLAGVGAFATTSTTKGFPSGATQSVSEPTGNRTVAVSWNAATNAYVYEVQVEGSNDNSTWTVLQTLGASPYTYAPATSYSYTAAYYRYYRSTVRARDNSFALTSAAYGDGGTSSVYVYRQASGTNPQPPTIGTIVPSQNSASVSHTITSSPGSNTINWDRWSLDQVNWNNVYASPFTISGLSSGTPYTVYMQSLNYDNLTSSNASSSFTTTSNLIAPTITSVTGDAPNVKVNFSGGSTGVYYQIAWYTSNRDMTSIGSYDVYGSSSPITATDLLAPYSGSTFYFWVRAVSSPTTTSVGPSPTVSAWSPVATWTAPTLGAPVYNVSNNTPTPYWPSGAGINVTGATSNIMTVTWNAASGTVSSYADQVSGVYNSTLYNTGTNTRDTWGYTISGYENASVYAYNTNTATYAALISWTASSGASSYIVYYTVGGVANSQTTSSTSVSITTTSAVVVTGVTAYSQAGGTGTYIGGSAGVTTSITPTSTSASSTAVNFYLTYYPTYTVTYNANGGTVSPASASGISGTVVTLPTPSRSGYSFNGWYTASAGGSYLGGGGSGYTITSTTTIYAQWTSASPPATPTGLSISGSGLMTWNASAGATSYTVTYWLASSTNGANAFNAGTVNVGNTTSYQITYKNNPTTGVYCNYADGIVLASNAYGSSPYSAWYPSSTTYV